MFGFILKSLFHLELSQMQGVKYGYIWILLPTVVQLEENNLLNMLFFFPMCVLGFFIKLRCTYLCGFKSLSSDRFHWLMYLILMYLNHAVLLLFL